MAPSHTATDGVPKRCPNDCGRLGVNSRLTLECPECGYVIGLSKATDDPQVRTIVGALATDLDAEQADTLLHDARDLVERLEALMGQEAESR